MAVFIDHSGRSYFKAADLGFYEWKKWCILSIHAQNSLRVERKYSVLWRHIICMNETAACPRLIKYEANNIQEASIRSQYIKKVNSFKLRNCNILHNFTISFYSNNDCAAYIWNLSRSSRSILRIFNILAKAKILMTFNANCIISMIKFKYARLFLNKCYNDKSSRGNRCIMQQVASCQWRYASGDNHEKIPITNVQVKLPTKHLRAHTTE